MSWKRYIDVRRFTYFNPDLELWDICPVGRKCALHVEKILQRWENMLEKMRPHPKKGRKQVSDSIAKKTVGESRRNINFPICPVKRFGLVRFPCLFIQTLKLQQWRN